MHLLARQRTASRRAAAASRDAGAELSLLRMIDSRVKAAVSAERRAYEKARR